MAKSVLCVACAQLPLKDGSLAIKKQQCPECKTFFGVTSYGSAFRIQPARSRIWLSPLMITGVTIASGMFVFGLVSVGLGLWTKEQIAPPRRAEAPPPSELSRIREVALMDKISASIQPQEAKRRLAELIQQIKIENARGQDQFLIAQIDRRPELRGMPFVMGDACRLDMNRARSFQSSVEAARSGFDRESPRFGAGQEDRKHAAFWNAYFTQGGMQGTNTESGINALTQMIGPERASLRGSLVKRLELSDRPEATRALARAAIFDTDGDVRVAALEALKNQPKMDAKELNAVLMQGIRYPMASVAGRAAQAMMALERKDLVPQLVEFLGEPAPGDPMETKVEDKKVCVVREVVRVNHHRNCLLCHAPSQNGSTQEVPGVIPIPGVPFPESPSEAYGAAQGSGDPMIRADTTYLRQDFSMLLPVENAAPWPDKQRFDFMVRARPVEGKELEAMQHALKVRPADFASENHKAANEALMRLTGHEGVAPQQAAWRRILGAAARNN